MPSVSEITTSRRLSSHMTLGQVLETAMAFETAAHRFYSELAARVGGEIRPLVRELAAEELHHYELLQRLALDERVGEQLEHRIENPPTADVFDDYIHIPPLPPDPLEADILDYAATRERIAYEHYSYLAERTPPGPLRALFKLLRDEEDGHLHAIQSRETLLFSIF